MMMDALPSELTLFDMTVDLLWQKIPILETNYAQHECDAQTFYLAIPGIARFFALPEDNRIIIEKASPEIPMHVLNTWLMGTVMAYMLQSQGYLVLHGSAVLINGRAVILSGQSGAGKSTLASALLKQGHPFITDDLVVIKQHTTGQYSIIPGPAQSKLWRDAASHLDHDIEHAQPVNLKTDKYAISVTNYCDMPMIPIAAFYELNIDSLATTFSCVRLTDTLSLRTLIHNAYRYFMLKPLGKLQSFLNDCGQLTQQIAVNKITRRPDLSELSQIIQRIELDQGVTS
jgi:energy-coupling factor transporter ATP-binding protein EcfA2